MPTALTSISWVISFNKNLQDQTTYTITASATAWTKSDAAQLAQALTQLGYINVRVNLRPVFP